VGRKKKAQPCWSMSGKKQRKGTRGPCASPKDTERGSRGFFYQKKRIPTSRGLARKEGTVKRKTVAIWDLTAGRMKNGGRGGGKREPKTLPFSPTSKKTPTAKAERKNEGKGTRRDC